MELIFQWKNQTISCKEAKQYINKIIPVCNPCYEGNKQRLGWRKWRDHCGSGATGRLLRGGAIKTEKEWDCANHEQNQRNGIPEPGHSKFRGPAAAESYIFSMQVMYQLRKNLGFIWLPLSQAGHCPTTRLRVLRHHVYSSVRKVPLLGGCCLPFPEGHQLWSCGWSHRKHV